MRWISVKDRLPEPNEGVLVAVYCKLAGEYYWEIAWQIKSGDWDSNDDWFNQTDDEITHWMPLPEPPEDMTRVCKVCGKQFVGRRKNNTLCDVCGSPAMKARRTRAKKKMGAVSDAS